MFASRWHSPPKPASGVELRHRDVQRARAGRRRGCPARRPRARRRARRRGRASDALEQRRLARARRAHQVHDARRRRGRSRRGWRARSCCWRRARPRRPCTFVRCMRLHRPDLQVPLDLRQLAPTTADAADGDQQHGDRCRAMLMRLLLSAARSAMQLVEHATRRGARPRRARRAPARLSSATSSSSSPRHARRAARSRRRACAAACRRARGRGASTFTGSMPCASSADLVVVELGLDHVQRAGRLAARRGVEQDAAS